MDDIFTRILDLASYIGSPLLQFLDHYFGISDGHSGISAAKLWEECSPSESSSDHRYIFEEGSPSSKYDVIPNRMLRRSSNVKQLILLNRNTEPDAGQNHEGISLALKWLTLTVSGGLRIMRRVALAPWRFLVSYIRYTKAHICRTLARMQRFLHGSSDDIGWLQRAHGMPPVRDGTPRFHELLHDVRNGKHMLPDSFVYLLIPGLFSNHGPLYFVSTKRFFSKMGLACHIAKIHSEASVEHNAWELKHYIEELYWGSGKRVMLLGHSKGGVDAAAALSKYWKDLQGKVAGLALVQSPYGGTPIASDIVREGQSVDKETRSVMELIICKMIKGDFRSLEDLTYEKRREFIMNHKLPKEIPVISFHSEASIGPRVLATLTQIAHAELPWLPLPSSFTDSDGDFVQVPRQVPVVVPVSAAMALLALHLKLRYGEKSDGLVTCRDAEVPGSVVIKPDMKLDHAWMVYSSWKKNPAEPDCNEMCEAILTLLVELGRTKRPGNRREH